MLKERFGDWKTSFRYIPRVLERFREIDPDSTLDLVTRDHAFFRAFAAPSASKTALRFCRPVIGMDGTFLIRAQWATLLVAAAKDGNNQLVPLAFGLCESENKDSWKWFCEKLLTHFPSWPATHDASLISDRDKGLIPAVKELFPSQFPHYFCSWHLEQNVLKFGPNASELFKKLANCRTKRKFGKLTGSRPACKGARGRGWVTEPDGCGKTSQNGKDGSAAAKEEWSQGRPADTISAATISAATISASTNSAATISAATTSAATMPAATISAATISAATTSSATIPPAIISAAAISAATISAAP
ncbi:unnamed protein product [Closterium sp. Naga37s-1]|nr:unnamed protein product [Closterium sp. Naga37s-1]